MKKIACVVLLLAMALSFSSCEGFLDDYSYSPLNGSSSGTGGGY